MTDRELLELAAKAIGERVVREACELVAGCEGVMLEGIQKPWSPLTDDGDALRLAVKLPICLDLGGFNSEAVRVDYARSDKLPTIPLYEYATDDIDKAAATRRAIVRAAAEIGRVGVQR